ncbi:DNA primase DnaG [Olavius sp. associated proteobacterium Delta 1]|nr:DNA primase DnaG [Olavius sp. associated proteobacterium Delta 1]
MAIFIPEEKISEIKNAADIVDVVSESVILKKAGKNYIGLCPFHSEKTPSFTVSPDKQIFHCFGCSTGGNIFSFLMKQEGLSFPAAARHLAKRYGVDIPARPLSPAQKKKISERESVLDINRRAGGFYHQALLNSAAGQKARSYLSKRGISQKTIVDFKLGYAHDGWDHLLRFFSDKRISPMLLEKSGLILPRKNKSGHYDRFRNRVIFPIFDVNMQVIGFGGRVLDDALPKYLNSPETAIYNKSRSLYGIHRAKDKCRATGTVFIVEGYLDLIALHQHGVENSVATLGTALTADHVKLLTRYARRMILVYDSDEAGIRSAQRCIETFWKEHVDFRREDVFSEDKADTHILVLPTGHDPDSYIFEHGPEAFMAAASESPGIITFLMDCAVRKHGLTTEGKIRVISELQAPLAVINDQIAQAIYIQQLAERLGIAESAVLERIRAVATRQSRAPVFAGQKGAAAGEFPKRETATSNSGLAGPPGVNAGIRFERQIIAMMLQFPEILPEINRLSVLKYFENSDLESVGNMVLKFNPTTGDQVSELISRIENEAQQTIVASLAMEDESWNKKGCLRLLAKFVDTRQKHRSGSLLEEQIKAAEKSDDHALLLTLLNKKQKMAERSEKQKMAILSEK